jgi:hypothetical protein
MNFEIVLNVLSLSAAGFLLWIIGMFNKVRKGQKITLLDLSVLFIVGFICILFLFVALKLAFYR